MQEGEAGDGLAFPLGGSDEGNLVGQQLAAPEGVALLVPTLAPKEHHREPDRAHQLDVVHPADHHGRALGQVDRDLDGRLVGVDAVGDEREPERQASGPAREVDGEVRGVPLVVLVVAGVQDVEVARLLGQDLSRDRGVAVDQGGAVQGREEPLVGVHDEAVGVAKPGEEIAVRGREDRGAPVGAVDVVPEAVLAREAAEPLDVVDDAGVGGPRRGDHADHTLGIVVVGEGLFQVGPGEAVVVGLDQQRVDAEHVQGLADARVGVGGDGEAQQVRRDVGSVGPSDVASDGEAREVAHGAARDEGSTRARGHPRALGQERERLVLGLDDAGRLEPAGAVEPRTGHDHVEEQRVLGGGVGDEGEEARRVDRDDRWRELLLEELQYQFRILPLGADQAFEVLFGHRHQAAEVQRHRMREPIAAVVEDGVAELRVVLKHLISHTKPSNSVPSHRTHLAGAAKNPPANGPQRSK